MESAQDFLPKIRRNCPAKESQHVLFNILNRICVANCLSGIQGPIFYE